MIYKDFDRLLHADLFHKIKCYIISGQTFGLVSSFLSNRRLRVVLVGKSSQEYPVNAGVSQGSIFGPTLFPPYINDLPDDDDDDEEEEELFFVVWLTNERRLALFPTGNIVRDPHHLETLTCREQDLNLRRTWIQALLNEVVR